MMTYREFHVVLRSLYVWERFELEYAIGHSLTNKQWKKFKKHPAPWFLSVTPYEAEKIYDHITKDMDK